MRIVGVSFDEPQKNKEWHTDKGFSFELWSDADRELALYYGAADSEDAKVARRLTRLLDANGEVLLEYTVGLRFSGHPEEVLRDCKRVLK